MLEPKEIDTYFNNDMSKDKPQKSVFRHTRKVMLAKLALPSLAAILAVTLLTYPHLKKDTKEFGLDFSISEGDIEKLSIEKTTIYVTDKNNRINNFVAQTIKETSAGSQKFSLSSPEAIMPLSHNEWVSIKSSEGLYNQQQSLLHLRPQVEIFFSRGMNLQTAEVFFDFQKSFGYSYNPVNGNGFIGNINAEGFEVSGQENKLTFLGKTQITINEETFRKE